MHNLWEFLLYKHFRDKCLSALPANILFGDWEFACSVIIIFCLIQQSAYRSLVGHKRLLPMALTHCRKQQTIQNLNKRTQESLFLDKRCHEGPPADLGGK